MTIPRHITRSRAHAKRVRIPTRASTFRFQGFFAGKSAPLAPVPPTLPLPRHRLRQTSTRIPDIAPTRNPA